MSSPPAGQEETGELDTQVDRTVLSWARTAATLAIASLLFARWAREIGPVALLPALFGVSAAALIGLYARVGAGRRKAQFANGQAKPPLAAAAALCGISVLLAGVGLFAMLLG